MDDSPESERVAGMVRSDQHWLQHSVESWPWMAGSEPEDLDTLQHQWL